jgi:hypothetical protein
MGYFIVAIVSCVVGVVLGMLYEKNNSTKANAKLRQMENLYNALKTKFNVK